MIKFSIEKFDSELIYDIDRLVMMQDEELWSHWPHNISINWQFYLTLANNGNLIAIVARDTEDLHSMVAYAVFIVIEDPHYKEHVIAKQDSLYVMPDYRSQIGSDFITICEREIKENTNAEFIYQCVLPQKDFTPILKKKGYDLIETTMVKRIR